MRIGIAGAGLAGRLLAWQLLRRGHSVDLFDRDNGDGQKSAGLIAAAMLAPCSELITAERAVFAPGITALEQWRQWLSELQADSDLTVAYQQRGSVVIAHRADQADLQWFYQRLQALPEITAGHCRWLSNRMIRELEPELSAFESGIYLPCEGCLDNRALFAALSDAIGKRGGRWHCGEQITEVTSGQLTTANGSFDFDLVLDCRGFGGKPQLNNFRGVRGEVLWVQAPEVNFSRPVRLMHPRYQLYIAPKSDSVYVIGATEIESESLAPVTVRSSLELLSALYSVHSGFAEGTVLEARSNCRPAFMNNLPHIVQRPGLMRVNGLYRHGYLLGPAMIHSVLALMDHKPAHAPIIVDDGLSSKSAQPCEPAEDLL